MNLTHRTEHHVLVSLSTRELGVLEQALTRRDSPDARECLASLRAQTATSLTANDTELVEAWADGASVQVRAITVHGDPVDMGTAEARLFAQRILDAAHSADG
jgi:hypothetical protein